VKAATVKLWLGGAGLVVGLGGMALEIEWIVWVAVACLAAAFLLRFVKRPSGGVDA
jgi:membrane protein implicated in regulation of membrane protease activity